MSWNYRIIEYADGSGFGLHEVYYGNDGKEKSMTVEPVRFGAESAEELRSSVALARFDAFRRPVFKEPAEWAEKPRRHPPRPA